MASPPLHEALYAPALPRLASGGSVNPVPGLWQPQRGSLLALNFGFSCVSSLPGSYVPGARAESRVSPRLYVYLYMVISPTSAPTPNLAHKHPPPPALARTVPSLRRHLARPLLGAHVRPSQMPKTMTEITTARPSFPTLRTACLLGC